MTMQPISRITNDVLLRLVCLCWLAIRCISYKTWVITDRTFPIIPVFDGLANLNKWFYSIPFFLSMAGIALLILKPRSRFLMLLIIVTTLFSGIIDIMVWQPWEFQFLFTLVVFLINGNNQTAIRNSLIFMFAMIYMYSGIVKINGGFLYLVWEKMILRDFLHFDITQFNSPFIHYFGLIIPALEILGGLFLIIFSPKRWPALLMILTHLFLILMIIVLGVERYPVIFPWNITMALMLYFMIVKERHSFSFGLITSGRNIVVAVFWAILPAFAFIDCWPKKFSSTLYAGNTPYLIICIPEANVPENLAPFKVKVPIMPCGNSEGISVYQWAFNDFKLLPSAEAWYYNKLRKEFLNQYPNSNAIFYLYKYPFKEVTELE
jgi:hypothetical protein